MQSTIEPNTSLQIEKPKPNPILGQITSLSYHGNGNNPVEFKMREDNSGNVYTFTAYANVNLDCSTIKIVNFNDFSFRLQEAFNNEFLVSIFHEDNKIVVLEIARQVQVFDFDPATATIGRPPKKSTGTGGGG